MSIAEVPIGSEITVPVEVVSSVIFLRSVHSSFHQAKALPEKLSTISHTISASCRIFVFVPIITIPVFVVSIGSIKLELGPHPEGKAHVMHIGCGCADQLYPSVYRAIKMVMQLHPAAEAVAGHIEAGNLLR